MASETEEAPEQSGSAAMATPSQLQQAGRCEAEADNQCSVCLGTINNEAYIDGCFHTFCFSCIRRWAAMRAVCLLCRRPFDRVLHTVRADDDYQEYVVGSSACQERTTAREPARSRPLRRHYHLRPRPTTHLPAVLSSVCKPDWKPQLKQAVIRGWLFHSSQLRGVSKEPDYVKL